jgi:hypothetical protein
MEKEHNIDERVSMYVFSYPWHSIWWSRQCVLQDCVSKETTAQSLDLSAKLLRGRTTWLQLLSSSPILKGQLWIKSDANCRSSRTLMMAMHQTKHQTEMDPRLMRCRDIRGGGTATTTQNKKRERRHGWNASVTDGMRDGLREPSFFTFRYVTYVRIFARPVRRPSTRPFWASKSVCQLSNQLLAHNIMFRFRLDFLSPSISL